MDIDMDSVKLEDRVHLNEKVAPNRFANNFLPPPESNDPLVRQSLLAFARQVKTIDVLDTPFVAVDEIQTLPKIATTYSIDDESQIQGTPKESPVPVHASMKTKLEELFRKGSSSKLVRSPSAGSSMVDDENELVDMSVSQTMSEDDVRERIGESVRHLDTILASGFFWRYHPGWESKRPLEKSLLHREPAPLWVRDNGFQFLISATKLQFPVGVFEAFFCSLTLYDLENGCRISETFHFDLNDANVLTGTLQVAKYNADQVTLARHAIFSVTERSESVCLVLRVERCLQEDDMDPYLKKVKSRSKKDLDQFSDRARMNMNWLPNFRQPFAWAVMPLFNEIGDLLASGPLTFESLYVGKESLSDAEFIPLAVQALTPNAKPVAKTMPGAYFTFRLDELEDDGARPTNCVDPSAILLANTENTMQLPDGSDSKVSVVREVLQFPLPSYNFNVPFTQFVNLLYVYPQSVTFNKFRNICCQVQVRASDESVDQDGMKILVSRSSSSSFTSRMLSHVNYHNKSPSFAEEMKVMLPLSLSTRVHLFFTFLQVNVKKKSGKNQYDIIGYSVLPFYPKAVLVQDGTFELRVAAKLPDFYMRPYLDGQETDTLHFRNGGEPSFRVRLKVMSSVFSQARDVNTFFQSFPSDAELNSSGGQFAASMLQEAVSRILDVPPPVLVEFLPPFLDFLFDCMSKRPQAAFHAFIGVCYVVHRVSAYLQEGTSRNSVLAAYVANRFDNCGDDQFYTKYTQQWLTGINGRRDPEPEKKGLSISGDEDDDDDAGMDTWAMSNEKKVFDGAVLKYSWFHFEVLRKSLTLERKHKSADDCENLDEFTDVFEEMIYAFVQAMYMHRHDLLVTKSANTHLAQFFIDMFYVLPGRVVVSMIQTYLLEFSSVRTDAQLLSLLCGHYDVLFDSNTLVDVFDPFSWTLPDDADEDIIEVLRERFPVAALLADLTSQCLRSSEGRVHKNVLRTLRHVLTRHDYDASLTSDRKSKVANMYVPLLPAMLSAVSQIVEMDVGFKQQVLACFQWIFNTCDLRVLRVWWSSSYVDTPTLVRVLHMMELSVSQFKYEGYLQRKEHTDFQPGLAPESAIFSEYTNKFGGSNDRLDALENLYSNLQTAGGTLDRQKMKAWKAKSSVSAVPPVTGDVTSGGTLRSRRAQLAVAPPVKAGQRSMTAGRGTLREMRAAMQRQARPQTNTLTINSKEVIFKLLDTEGAVSVTSTMMVINRFLSFTTDHMETMNPNSGSIELCRSALELLVSLLQYPQTNDASMAVYLVVRWFLQNLGVHIFRSFRGLKAQVDLVGGEVFRHCSMADVNMRRQALSLLYLLTTCNYDAHSNLDALQGSLTIILSKMVPEMDTSAAKVLQQVIECLHLYHDADDFSDNVEKGAAFRAELDMLCSRLQMILKSQLEVIRQKDLKSSADIRRIEQMFMQIADAFNHVPAIRIEWLNRLAEHHAENSNFAEAAQCFVAISELQASRRNELTSKRRMSDNPEELVREALMKAVHFLDKAHLYEQAYECYKTLLKHLEAEQDWKRLHESFAHLAKLTSNLVTTNDVRIFGTYYRVGFYGSKFGEINGKEYIYKMPQLTQLSEVSKHLTEVYTRQFMTSVKVAKNSDTLNLDELDADDCLLQVTFVSPYFSPEEENSRITHVEKNTNIKTFTYSTPFTKDGKRHGGIAEQYQKVSVVSVEHPFPWLQTSQEIVKREETVLTPIENAVTDVEARTKTMQRLLSTMPVDTKSLGGILAGSVATQVNEGAVQMCKVFLGETSKLEATDTAKLRSAMQKFLEAMQHGLTVYRKLMSQSPELTQTQKDFLTNLDVMFQEQCAILEPLLKEPSKKKRRAIRFQ